MASARFDVGLLSEAQTFLLGPMELCYQRRKDNTEKRTIRSFRVHAMVLWDLLQGFCKVPLMVKFAVCANPRPGSDKPNTQS